MGVQLPSPLIKLFINAKTYTSIEKGSKGRAQ
jgi:hypothetical protein